MDCKMMAKTKDKPDTYNTLVGVFAEMYGNQLDELMPEEYEVMAAIGAYVEHYTEDKKDACQRLENLAYVLKLTLEEMQK